VTIVEFLTARLDEREALARAAARGEEDPGWQASILGTDGEVKTWRGEPVAVYSDADDVATYPLDADVALFISYNDPAHVLADIAAKRAIVAWCGERDQIYIGTMADNPELPKPSDFAPGHLRDPADAMVLRHLAAVDADHPDYDPEWRP